MNKIINAPKINKGLFWLIAFILFCFLVYTLKPVLLPFVAGILIGYLFDPLASRFEKLGLNRAASTFLVILSILIILVPAVIMLFSVIDNQVIHLLNSAPDYIASTAKKIDPFLADIQEKFPNLNVEKLKEYLRSNAANGLKLVVSLLKNIITGGFAFFSLLSLLLITPIVSFYMLRDWKSFVKKVDNLLPRNNKKDIREIARQIDKTIAGFIRGQLSVCVILGTYYSLGLHFVGLELGLLIGFIAGIISFIPYVGSITGFVISLAMAFAQFGDYTHIIYVVLVFATGQFMEGNFLTPKLVGDSIGLHPVWVLFALLSGGVLLGFLGLMIAVPLAGIIGVLARYNIEKYKKSSLYLG